MDKSVNLSSYNYVLNNIKIKNTWIKNYFILNV